MKYLGIYQSKGETDATIEITEAKEIILPVKYNTYVSGTIRNRLAGSQLIVGFYSANREVQQITLEGGQTLQVKNQPADRLEFDKPARAFIAALDYVLRVISSSNDAEDLELFVQSELSVSSPEIEGERFDDQSVFQFDNNITFDFFLPPRGRSIRLEQFGVTLFKDVVSDIPLPGDGSLVVRLVLTNSNNQIQTRYCTLAVSRIAPHMLIPLGSIIDQFDVDSGFKLRVLVDGNTALADAEAQYVLNFGHSQLT